MATQINDDKFKDEVLDSNQLVVVDFWAEWCGPCRSLSPIVDQVSEEFKGKVNIFKMDVDANSETPSKYGIRNIPTILFFKDGEVKEKSVGLLTKEKLVEMINNLM